MAANRRPVTCRGFTVVELVVVLAIIGVIAALAFSALTPVKGKASLASAAAELQATISAARSTAMATGHDVGVLVFPDASGSTGSVGRVIVYEDGNFDFFAAGTVNFAGYNPLVLAAGDRSRVLSSFDLPRNVVFGPATGQGTGATLPAPLAGVNVQSACSFCDAGTVRRGAIRFNGRGQAAFYRGNAIQTVSGGASLSLNSTDAVGGTLTLAVIANSGAVRLVTAR